MKLCKSWKKNYLFSEVFIGAPPLLHRVNTKVRLELGQNFPDFFEYKNFRGDVDIGPISLKF